MVSTEVVILVWEKQVEEGPERWTASHEGYRLKVEAEDGDWVWWVFRPGDDRWQRGHTEPSRAIAQNGAKAWLQDELAGSNR